LTVRGSVRAYAVQPQRLAGVALAARVDGRLLFIELSGQPHTPDGRLPVLVSLLGIRKGMTQRWPTYTEAQARQNNAFWQQAILEGP
jgi:hypothetical protein